MALSSSCHGCLTGDHEKHRRNFNGHPEGLIGGTYCDCKGDCKPPDLSEIFGAEPSVADPKPKARAASYLSPHQFHRLDLACLPIVKAWPSYGPVLVGSVLERPDYRDVDVRVILNDDDWDAQFGAENVEDDGGAHQDPHWLIVCSAISHWLGDVSGLPVDFQIQRATQANADPKNEGKFRNPLGHRVWTR